MGWFNTLVYDLWNSLRANFNPKLAEVEVSAIARKCAERVGWSTNVVQSKPKMEIRNRKLVWCVWFYPSEDYLAAIKGGHLFIMIDDETSEVIEKVIGTR
jgi:hypothetical protein